ncbi:MAG: TonB-dependent receptor P26 [Petrimonas sp.]|uniref:SusC/RagA family TonB-linked outer membrane protein n=1 Tax=Petrimonas sp. TaxID=2023866 RepID=UPI0030D5EAEF
MKERHSTSKWKGLLFAMLWTISLGMFAQNVIVKGNVTDANNEPVIGATIVVQGRSTHGTVTDIDGNYTLVDVPSTASLIFSYVGMQTRTVGVEGKTIINVQLLNDTELLDEVVVIGYGTSSKRDLTSAIATVDAEKMKNLPTASVTDGLAGRAAGIIVQKAGGGLGQKSTISIRGGGTPLVVIDDFVVPYSDFENLNSDDIESMSILKDASAAAVYGARAGDGIIVVKTKSGSNGLRFDYSFNQNWSHPTYMAKRIDSYETALLNNRINKMYNLTEPYNAEALEAFRTGSDPYNFPNTDWQELTLRKFAPENKHSLSFQSGYNQSDVFANKLFASFQTYNQESMYKINSNWLKRHNLRLNEEVIFKKIGLKLNFGVDGYIETNRQPLSQYSNSYWYTWSHIQNNSTMLIPLNKFGQPYLGFDNPLVELSLESGYNKRETSTINTTFGAELDIPKVNGLKFRTSGNYRMGFYDGKAWNKTAKQYDLEGNPGPEYPMDLFYTKNKATQYTLQYFLNYKNSFNDTHNVEATAGFEHTYGFYTNTGLGRKNYVFEIDQIGSGPASTMENSGGEDEVGRAGFVGRASYNYKKKYYIEGSLRRDGSDLFPKDKRWGTFYAGTVAYAISEEDFFAPLRDRNILNFFKIRANYGQIGLDSGVGRFSYLPSYGYNERGYTVDGNLVPTFNEGALISNDITWYTRNSTNIGLDFSSLARRLSGSLEYFYMQTTGYLSSPSNVGYTDPLGTSLPNVKSDGEHRRAGFDATLTWKDTAGNLTYEVGVNVTYFDQLIAKSWSEDLASQKNPYKRGVQQTGYWGQAYINKGFYNSADEVLMYPRLDGSTGITAGDLRYEDFNGDGFIDGNDFVRLGKNGFPRANYGIFANTSYKGFFANVLFQGSSSRDLYMGDVLRGGLMYGFMQDFWTPDNRNATYPRRLAGNYSNGGNNGATSDFWLVNGRYIRLKTLQLGYNFKNILFKNVTWIRNCQVVLSGQNLLTWSPTTKFEIDPETADMNNYGYPTQRVYSISFNVGF